MKGKHLLAVLLAALVLVSIAGCSAESESVREPAADQFYGGIYDSADNGVAEKVMDQTSTSTGSTVLQNQKLVRTMTLEAETDDMDALMSELDRKVNALGGYVEYKSMRNGSSSASHRYRYVDMTIRIPADQLDAFVDHISGQTNVVYHNESADDITLRYVATQSRITALETEQQRLLELLAKAENMSDLLMIEERLTNVRTELEEVTSQMRLYDNMVNYGTVKLSVTEVQEYTVVEEETVWQKIGSGLSDSWSNLCEGAEAVFVFAVVSLPYLLPIGAAAAVTLLAVKLATRKKPRKEEPPKAEE